MSISSTDDASASAILETVDLPLVALGEDFCVEVVNDAFLKQFRLSRRETLGHVFSELGNGQWDIPELRQLLERVLKRDGLVTDYRIEHDFEWIGKRVMRLNARRINSAEGRASILLAISDETERERLKFELDGHVEFKTKLIDSIRESLLILHWDLRVHSANQTFYDLFNVDRTSTVGRLVYELGNGQWNIPVLRHLLEDVLPRDQAFDDFEVDHTFEGIGRRIMLLNGRRLDHLNLIVLAFRDITEQRAADEKRSERERRQAFLLSLSDAVRPMNDPKAICLLAAGKLGEELAASRTAYYERENGGFVVAAEHTQELAPQDLHQWPDASLLQQSNRGETIVVPDVSLAQGAAVLGKPKCLVTGAYIWFPFVEDGTVVGGLAVHANKPRSWKPAEVELVQEVASRTRATLERVRAEFQRDASEARARAQASEIETIYASAHVGLCVLDRELRFQRINAKLAEINGLTVDEHIGRTVRELFPTLADTVEPRLKAVLETGEPLIDHELSGETPAQPGVRRTWVEQWLPLRDASGAITGINIAVDEVTERKQAEQRLQAAHDTFRSLVDHSPFGIFVVDADFRVVHVSDGARKVFESVRPLIGRDFSEVVRINWTEPFASECIGQFRHTLEVGERYRWPQLIEKRADTSVVEAYDCRIERVTLPDGRPGVVCHFYDLSERHRLEQQLAIAAERAEIAQQAVHAMFYEFLPGTGEAIRSRSAFEALTGYGHTVQLGTGDWWRSIMHPDDVDRVWQEVEKGVTTRRGFKIDYRIRHCRGHYVWVHDHASVLPASGENPARIVGMVLDITQQKEREEHEQLLMREVNHRAKNMLGLVSAVARQTAAGDPKTFVKRFEDRIHSLAASQDLLVQNNWRNVPLENLVCSQLGHFRDLIGARIHVSGPPLAITAAAAQPLGMALHELATNAAKHGALSNATGSVSLSWNILDARNGEPRFSICWSERGGPPVAEPSRRGFGSRVIGDMVKISLGGEVELDFAPNGLIWRATCPADRLLETQSRGRSAAEGAQTKPLTGAAQRVLVVEDEAVIAMELEDILRHAGYEVLGPANSIDKAVELLDAEGCDAAVLDVNLGRETAVPVAQLLTSRGTPFLTVSGYALSQRPLEFGHAPHLDKPLKAELLVRTLKACLEPTNSL